MKRYFVVSIMGDIRASQVGRLAREYVDMIGAADHRSLAGLPSPLPGVSILYLCNVWATDRAAAERMAALNRSQGSASRVLTSWPHDVSDWQQVKLNDDPGEFHCSPSTVADMARVIAGEVLA